MNDPNRKTFDALAVIRARGEGGKSLASMIEAFAHHLDECPENRVRAAVFGIMQKHGPSSTDIGFSVAMMGVDGHIGGLVSEIGYRFNEMRRSQESQGSLEGLLSALKAGKVQVHKVEIEETPGGEETMSEGNISPFPGTTEGPAAGGPAPQ